MFCCGFTFSFDEDGKTFRAPSSAFNLTYSSSERMVTPGSTSSVTNDDIVLTRHATAEYITEAMISVNNLLPLPEIRNVTFSSDNESIATVDQNGKITYVSDGTAIIKAIPDEHSNWYTQKISVPVSHTLSGTTDVFTDFTTGTFGEYITDQIESLIASLTSENVANKILEFSAKNDTTHVYTRNSNCWASSIDLTPIIITSSSGNRNGCLISPRHIIFCDHYQYNVGDTIYFVSGTNETVSRTLASKTSITNTQRSYPDITIGLLNEDVPASIGFAKVLPANWLSSYCPNSDFLGTDNIYAVGLLPMIMSNKEKKLYINTLQYMQLADMFPKIVGSGLLYDRYSDLPFPQRAFLDYTVVGGDSGSPVFFVIDNKMVLLYVNTFGGTGSGADISSWITQINSIMATLQGGATPYQLTVADLSGFTNFAE